MSTSLVVKVTVGPRRTPSGATRRSRWPRPRSPPASPVSLWLTGEAAWFAVPGRAEEFKLPHATPLADLLDGVLARRHGDGVHPVRGPTWASPRPTCSTGVRIAGAAVFVEESLAEGAQALVY